MFGRLVHLCGMSLWYVRRGWFICTRALRVYSVTLHLHHGCFGDLFICAVWLFHMCNVTHLYQGFEGVIAWHGPFVMDVLEIIMMCFADAVCVRAPYDIQPRVWHVCVTWLVHMCDMTHSYVWHDSFMCVTWLIHVCNMTHSCAPYDIQPRVWHVCVTWLVHMCVMTRSCVTWLVHMCDMTHSYERLDSFICVAWLAHMCDMTRSYVWHDPFMCALWYTASSLPCVCDMTRT